MNIYICFAYRYSIMMTNSINSFIIKSFLFTITFISSYFFVYLAFRYLIGIQNSFEGSFFYVFISLYFFLLFLGFRHDFKMSLKNPNSLKIFYSFRFLINLLIIITTITVYSLLLILLNQEFNEHYFIYYSYVITHYILFSLISNIMFKYSFKNNWN